MKDTIRIKFVSKTKPEEIETLWRPLLPAGKDRIGSCLFTFDPDDTSYDFLVVYEDLPPLLGDTKILRTETLACARQNTMLLTTEPPSIRIDGPHYLRQFGHVWTHKDPSLVRHPYQLKETPPLRFFFGRNLTGGPQLSPPETPPQKTKRLSAMSSTKAMKHTVHAQRLHFMKALKERLGSELDLFGRGIADVDDKAEAMADYRYHVAVENHIEAGHFTEKLTDCFVANCLPFYFGDPAYTRVFPERSVIPINIFDLDQTETIIRHALANDEFERRRASLEKARSITLERFNTLRAVATKVETLYQPGLSPNGVVYGRHAFRKAHPVKAIEDALFITRARRHPRSKPLQGIQSS